MGAGTASWCAIGATLARRGMLDPGAPLRIAAQLSALALWGHGLAGELRQAAARSPDRVAVIDERRGEITYAALLTRADTVAEALRERGIGPGDRVGLLARNHVGAIEAMVGAGVLGCDVVLLNTGLSGPQLAAVVCDQDLVIVIHDDEFAPVVAALPDGEPHVGETDWEAELAARPAPGHLSPPPRVGRTIILTSGTTGLPKGAARRTPRGVGPLVSVIDRIPVRVGDRVLVSAPLFHTWGFAAFQICLALRATMVLQRRFEPLAAMAALESHACEAMFAVPVMLQRMMEHPPAASLERLRVVATSGSAYPHGFATGFMDTFGDVLHNLYGSTEASWVCIATPRDLRRHPDTAGTPPLFTRVALLDDAGEPVGPGEKGRIYCRNSLVFDGYTSGDEHDRVDGMVATGDVGHVEDGLWFVDGRADDMVISGGENIYPGEVESLLHAHPDVREVAVCGIPDPDFGQRLAAFVVLHTGAALSADDVRSHVRDNRSRHCVPREVRFLDELPRNASGKVLLTQLRRSIG